MLSCDVKLGDASIPAAIREQFCDISSGSVVITESIRDPAA